MVKKEDQIALGLSAGPKPRRLPCSPPTGGLKTPTTPATLQPNKGAHMYEIVINPTALQILKNHPYSLPAAFTASIIGTAYIIHHILHPRRTNTTPKRRSPHNQHTRNDDAAKALEALMKNQNQ